METPARSTFIPVRSNSATDFLVGILWDAHVTTLRRLENLTQEEFDWRYADGWNTVSALVAHVTSLKHLFRVEIIEHRSWTREERLRWGAGLELGAHVPRLSGVPVETRIGEMAEAHKLLEEGVRSISPDDFACERHDRDGFGRFNAAWALYHAAEDEVHHRGQISMLRKLYRTLRERP